MKRLISLIALAGFILGFAGCQNLAVLPSSLNSSYHIAYAHPYDEDRLLISYVEYEGEVGAGKELGREYFLMGVKDKSLEKVLSSFDRSIYFDFNAYHPFDFHDFVALNKASSSSSSYEIGRFDSNTQRYTSLIENDSVELLSESIKDDQVLFCYNDDPDQRENKDMFIMDRKGSLIHTIPLGVYATISRDFVRLDESRSCFTGWNGPLGKVQYPGVVFFFNHELNTVTPLKEQDTYFDYVGIIDHHALIQIDDKENATSATFYLYDFDGNRKKELFSIDHATWNRDLKIFINDETQSIYVAYISIDKQCRIMKYQLGEGSLGEVFNCKVDGNTENLWDIAYNGQEDLLSFLVKDRVDKWYFLDLKNDQEELILPPKNSECQLSDDGRNLLCLNCLGKTKNHGVINYKEKVFTPFNKKMDVFGVGKFYVSATQEFYFSSNDDKHHRILFSVNPKGEINGIEFEK
jgi:hypothetical protein